MNIDLKTLGEKLEDVLRNQGRYHMDLVIKEFDGADFLFFYMYEPHADAAPTFYFVTSPWDAHTNKAPQSAQVFKNGDLVLNINYTEYVKVRTGVMDAFALRALQADLRAKNILYIGAGGVAEWSLRALKAYFPEVETLHYAEVGGVKESFENLASELGVSAVLVSSPDIAAYDYIFMHTNSRTPVCTEADVARIKEGAFISLFSDKEEASREIYKNATVVVNWMNSFEKEVDLIKGKEEGLVDMSAVKTMQQLLEGEVVEKKHHTVFRSGGTPMQNIAMLQYLIENE